MMKPISYETVTSIDEKGGHVGRPGATLYSVPRTLLLTLTALAIYAFTSVGFTIYISRCPLNDSGFRVLSTGNLPVEQLYSGVALSAIMMPAALLIRRLAYDMALLHPFAIASKTPIELADLDLLADPGMVAMGRLFNYSVPRALIQAIVMITGALLVPVGTLLVFPGLYSAPAQGTGVVGMPTELGNMMTMSITMSVAPGAGNYSHDLAEDVKVDRQTGDSFLETATNMFVGNTIRQLGVLEQIPSLLGPTETWNLTYQDKVVYDGIVTYSWTSGCAATDDITFTEITGEYEWIFNVTMPDGSTCNNLDAYETGYCVTNATDAEGHMTTYYALMGVQSVTVNFDDATSDPQSGVTVSNGSWISRVACTPTLTWEVSSCLWDNGSFTQCNPAPGHNTASLDVLGLDLLQFYITSVPLYLYAQGFYTFGLDGLLFALMFDPQGTNTVQYRVPLIQDFNSMYGLVAQSIVSVTTAGYYGTAEVPTYGSTPQPAYLVRTYILALLVVALVVCAVLPMGVLFWSYHVHRTPLRRATFLTIANAVRGHWWDLTMWGTCLMKPAELRDAFRGIKVMFGATLEQPHVGLATNVTPICEGQVYFGVAENNAGTITRMKECRKTE